MRKNTGKAVGDLLRARHRSRRFRGTRVKRREGITPARKTVSANIIYFNSFFVGQEVN